jgi:signal peptidase I
LPAAARARPARAGREIIVLAAMVTAAVALAVAFRAFVARPYRVLSASMLPTLEPDDLVAGATRAYPRAAVPSRADVIVFRGEAIAGSSLPENVVKRVIGLPGDRISMRGGTPVINGWPVPSCDVGAYLYVLPDPGDPGLHGRLRLEFLEDRVYLAVYSVGRAFEDEYMVMPGEVFVLGDNRGNSMDSRSFNAGHGGGVPIDSVEAKATRFLAGTHRNGGMDLARLFQPIDRLQLQLRLEGVETGSIDKGIARCLAARPNVTSPPPP